MVKIYSINLWLKATCPGFFFYHYGLYVFGFKVSSGISEIIIYTLVPTNLISDLK